MRPAIAFVCALWACSTTNQPSSPDSEPQPATPVLVNGWFEQGLDGWVAEGDASKFRVFADPKYGMRPSVTTFVPSEADVGGGRATGTLTQSFAVPEDAAALRFVVHGGYGRVRLLDGGRELKQVAGPGSNDDHVLVNWSLVQLRGKVLKLVIDDSLDAPPWAFISVSGFDVVRERPCSLKNAGFADGLNGWRFEGDADKFTWFRDAISGNRWSVSTASQGPGMSPDAARGKLEQSFVVPPDAVALRFAVHGGSRGAIRLWRDGVLLYEARGTDSNNVRIPITWDLRPLRGTSVTLAIEDMVADPPYGFIGTTGFDLVTRENGP